MLASQAGQNVSADEFVLGSVAPRRMFSSLHRHGSLQMRHLCPSSLILVVTALALAPALAPGLAYAQDATISQASPGALGPYKPVPVLLPETLTDPEFDAFRKQMAEIAQKKDRAALAGLVAASFFWVPEDTDIADKNASPIDNLTRALGLDGTDAVGWDALAAYALEAGAMADP